MSATIDPELRRAVIEIVDERFRELEVRRSAFIGLKEVVERRASAQVGTEGALKELAAAQKDTDQSLKELAAAQKDTDQSLKELAAAQKETEKALAELAAAQTRTDQQVGRLGDNIGFGLEDIARVVAPGYLLRHHGIKMAEFDRGYLNANGHPVEIDLYAEGRRNGKKVIILGEVKSRIHPREVKKFAGVIEKLKPHAPWHKRLQPDVRLLDPPGSQPRSQEAPYRTDRFLPKVTKGNTSGEIILWQV